MKTTRQKGMLWVLATLTIAVVPQVISMPPHLMVLVIAPLIWRTLAELRHWKPPGALIRISLTLLTVLALAFTHGGLMGRRTAVSLLTLMLAMKLLETFRVRDARLVASLSLFLCATQFLFSQGIPMLFYSAATLVCGLIALALLHRREAFAAVGDAPASNHSLFAELGFILRLLALSLPVALAIFLLFPRWSSPLWGVPERALDARSGLSGSMSPGSIQGLFMDDSPAFRVEFEGAVPPHNLLYWRGPVFWSFDGREWSDNYYSRRVPADTRPDDAAAPWRYRVQLEPHEQRWIFALDYPAMVPKGARLSMDYQLLSRRPITSLVSYDMASEPRFVDSPTLRPTFRTAALEVPADFNPRTLELMQRWRGETLEDQELVNRVLTYFNQEEFRYTLNPPLLSRHTVDEFLFETRSGFCEHYASAFTLMMRMAGIPARVVTGYQGGWYNETGDYLLVRQSDAHAWSEIWLEGFGWNRIDPTAAVAPERIDDGSLDAFSGRRHLFDFSWMRSMRNDLDWMQRQWNDWVIAFNAERQSRMLMPFGIDPLSAAQLVGLMLVLAALGSALTLPAILRLRAKRTTDPVVRAWKRFRRKLQRAGMDIYPGLSPMELAASAHSRMKRDADDIYRIAQWYTRIRYSEDPVVIGEFLLAVRAFKPARATQ
jgi:transglutaminase-like putative cysteine protease